MASTFASKLLTWFDQHGRKDLPWQQSLTLYGVWVSEIMLQQTQVNTVIPYYGRFMDRFPSIEALAQASQDEVLHQWTGLGYYARARNLHKAARIVMADFNGELPASPDELNALPGIGRSTAAAIVAICTGYRATILDGNVKRVLARCFAIEGSGSSKTQKALWQQAESLTPYERVADYTQAIMDLGAMICTRSSPVCQSCPFENDCIARTTDTIDQYPGKRPKKTLPVRATTMLVIANEVKELLLNKREGHGLWGGLWSFPECDTDGITDFLEGNGLKLVRQSTLPGFRHTFTHLHLDITPVKLDVIETSGVRETDAACWFSPEHPAEIGLTRPVSRILKTL